MTMLRMPSIPRMKHAARKEAQLARIGIIGSEGRMGHALVRAIAAAGHENAGGADKGGDVAELADHKTRCSISPHPPRSREISTRRSARGSRSSSAPPDSRNGITRRSIRRRWRLPVLQTATPRSA
jgi:hypothetical protein